MAHIAPLMGMLLIMAMVTSFKDVEALPVVLNNGASVVAVGGPAGPAAPVTSMFSCAGSLQTDFQFGAPFKPEVEMLLNGAFPCPEHCAQFAGFLRQQLQQWSNGNSLSQWNHRNAAFRRHQVGSVLLFSHYRAIRGELTSSAAASAGGVGGAPGGVALVGAPNGAHHHPDCNHNLAVLQRIEALLKDPHFEEELFVSVPYVAHIPHPVASPPVAVAVESTPVVKVVPPPPPPPPAVTVVASPPVVSLSCSAELVGKVLQVQTPLFPPVAAYLDGLSPEGCRAFQSGLQSALATNGMHLPSTTTPTTTNYIPNFAGRATVIIAGEGSNGAALPPGRETDESLKLITVQAVLRLLYACAKGRRGGLQVQPVHQEVHHAQPVQQVRQVQHVQPVQHVKEVHHVHHVQPVQQVHHQIVQQPLQQQREQVVMIQPNSNPSADVVTVVHSRSASLTGLDASSGAGVAGAGFPGNCHDVFATELLLGEIFSGRTAVSHSPPPPSPVVDTSSKVVVVSTAAGGPSNGASYVSAPVHTDTSKVIVSSGGGGGQIVNSGSTSDTKIIVSGGGGGGGQIVNPGTTDTQVIVTGGNSNGPIVSSGTENKVIVSGGSRYFEPGSGAAISSISNSNNGFGTGGSNVHYVSSSSNYGGQQGYDRGPVYSAGYPNSVGYENGGTNYGVSEYGGGGNYRENYGASIGSSGSSYGLGANRIGSNDGRYYSSSNGFNSAGNPHFSAGSYSGGQNGHNFASNNFPSGGYGMGNRFGHSAVGGTRNYGGHNFGGSNTYGGSFGGNGGNYDASGSSAIGGFNGASSGLSGTGSGVANYGGQGYSLDANGIAPNGGNLAGGLNGGAASSALGAAGGLAGLNSGNAALGSSLGAATGLVGNVAGTGNGVGNIAGQVLGTGTNSANGVLGSSLGAVTGLLNNVAGSGGAVSGQVLGAGANAANSGVATGTNLGSSVGGNAPSAGSAGGSSGGGASASASA